jgi:hypothetical protein
MLNVTSVDQDQQHLDLAKRNWLDHKFHSSQAQYTDVNELIMCNDIEQAYCYVANNHPLLLNDPEYIHAKAYVKVHGAKKYPISTGLLRAAFRSTYEQDASTVFNTHSARRAVYTNPENADFRDALSIHAFGLTYVDLITKLNRIKHNKEVRSEVKRDKEYTCFKYIPEYGAYLYTNKHKSTIRL